MVVHCELYLRSINRLDIPELAIHLIWISQLTEYSNYICLNCQDRNNRGLNPRPSANESNHLPLSYLEFYLLISHI